jgi:hypothetical protein
VLQPEDILSLFGKNVTVTKREESLDRFSMHAICAEPLALANATLSELLRTKDFADRLVITCTMGEAPVSFDSRRVDNGPFFVDWEKFQDRADLDDKAEIDIRIEKEIHDNNALFVYEQQPFFAYLGGLSTVEVIGVFSAQFKRFGSALFFICSDFQLGGHTSSIYFVTDLVAKNAVVVPEKDRGKTWDKLNGVSHLSGIGDCNSLPEDFEIVAMGDIPPTVQQQFQKASFLLLLGILYDFSTVNDGRLFLKLNGYKTFNVDVPIKDLKLSSLDIYYKIYCWVIAGGNMQDKIGLSRNLISLNIDPTDQYTVAPSVYNSILSGFKVYEKQNIKQYIELRNKMSDQLIGFNEKAGKIVETFAGSFQKSALAVGSLFASIIVTRVLSTHEFENIFSKDATILSFAFLVLSLVYFFVSRWEINAQKKRFEESYLDMKSRNEDLLTKEDIEKILNSDAEHNKDVQFIEEKQKWYSVLWIVFVVVLMLATLILSMGHHPVVKTPAAQSVDTEVVKPSIVRPGIAVPMTVTPLLSDTIKKALGTGKKTEQQP